MINTLGLTELRPVSEPREALKSDGSRYLVVEVVTVLTPTICPVCGGSVLHKHGVRQQEYIDAPHYGEPATLLVHRKRWRCKNCNKLFPDPLPDIDEKRRATHRLIQYVRKRAMTYTFSEVGREVGMSDKSIRAIFDDYTSELERKYEFVTPRYLGIDEVKIIGQYRCILTNVDKLTMYDLLPSRKLADLRKYFANFPNPKEVEYVTADLWRPYEQVYQEFFPHARMVADRFHVQRMATNAIEAVRKKVRKSLSTKDRLKMKDDRFILLKNAKNLNPYQVERLAEMLREFPELELAWKTNKRFVDCWEHTNKYDAEIAFAEWAMTVPEPMQDYFKEALNAWNNRKEHILNYFDNRVTNAYNESINRLAKSINRMGRGYSLEVVRARMLYDERALEKGSMIQRSRPKRLKTITTAKYYGAHIPTLCDELEAGDFD